MWQEQELGNESEKIEKSFVNCILKLWEAIESSIDTVH